MSDKILFKKKLLSELISFQNITLIHDENENRLKYL